MLLDEPAYGHWGIVIILSILASFFISKFIPQKTKLEKRSGNVLLAFIIALFTEMFGVPLTIYLLSAFLKIDIPLTHESGHLLGDLITSLGWGNGWMIVMAISTLMLAYGTYLITEGWRSIFSSDGKFIKTGLYSRVRHPQYSGIILAATAFLIQWPAILTVIMYPFVVGMYYNLAKKEENLVAERFPAEYRRYRKTVPMLFPRIDIIKIFTKDKGGSRA